MPTYVIASSSDADFHGRTRVPSQHSVRFYRPAASASGASPHDAPVAQWEEGLHRPGLTLRGDPAAGGGAITCSDLGTVVRSIAASDRLALTEALEIIRRHAQAHFPLLASAVVVHCRFTR